MPRLLMLSLPADRCFGHMPHATDRVRTAPQGWQLRAQKPKCLPQYARGVALQLRSNLGRSHPRITLDKAMHMVAWIVPALVAGWRCPLHTRRTLASAQRPHLLTHSLRRCVNPGGRCRAKLGLVQQSRGTDDTRPQVPHCHLGLYRCRTSLSWYMNTWPHIVLPPLHVSLAAGLQGLTDELALFWARRQLCAKFGSMETRMSCYHSLIETHTGRWWQSIIWSALPKPVSGSPLRQTASLRNREAASFSRCSVSKKSIVWACLSTAR
jgi:hypothetical protein